MSKTTFEPLSHHSEGAETVVSALRRAQVENAALEKVHTVYLRTITQIQAEATATKERLEAENDRLRKKLNTAENQNREADRC